ASSDLAAGWSSGLGDAAETVAGRVAPNSLQPAAIVFFYVVFLSVIKEAIGVPLAFYSEFLLERRYGLSNETLRTWLRDRGKAFAVGLVLGGGGVELIYWLMRSSPEWWWLTAGAVFTIPAPVVLLPLCYWVKPLG